MTALRFQTGKGKGGGGGRRDIRHDILGLPSEMEKYRGRERNEDRKLTLKGKENDESERGGDKEPDG